MKSRDFTAWRMVAIRVLRQIEPIFMELRTVNRHRRLMERAGSPFDRHRIKQCQDRADALRQDLKACRGTLTEIGGHLLRLGAQLDAEDLTPRQKAHLLGVSVKTVISAGNDIIANLAFAHAVEYRGMDDFIPLYEVSMPVYSAIRERMLAAIDENEAFREATNGMLAAWVDEARAAKRPRLVKA